jgi:hypothetical protein
MKEIRDGQVRGPRGDESVYASVAQFSTPLGGGQSLGSGLMVGMVVCRPALGDRAFAIVFDEKWPEFFGILHRRFGSLEDAAAEVAALEALDSYPVRRGEQLAGDVASRGWELVTS